MPNTLLLQFSYLKIPYRIIHGGRKLLLERGYTDLLGAPLWREAPVKEMCAIQLARDPHWCDVWTQRATHVERGVGEFLDTRDILEIPEESRGIVHHHTSRNDHAPSDHMQDVYVNGTARGRAFTSHVPVMVRVKGRDTQGREQVLLGAIYALARSERTLP